MNPLYEIYRGSERRINMKVIFSKEKYMKDREIRFQESETTIIKEVLEEVPDIWFSRLDGKEVEMFDNRNGIILDGEYKYQIDIDWCNIVK